ncbi:Nif3-like dinuclear metal center hexameric protein [Chitinibacter tainanensis]|uniref:Nif3-like dinuclear metal center hexameric protein n=1 Tax=Chitinibacter tainanensis TaxID=230667 RepID=UPI002353F310|nr:Nif3-like dinuclear metal center hexameric protein [Chitinibacter tainanensis]
MPIQRQELENYIGQLLAVARFKDYAPNGLQVEGNSEVAHIATAVTASAAAIDAAIACGADTLLVHHGYFWKGEDPTITRTKKLRIGKLLAHDLNLLAYHLPLDAHPELGNNAQLAKKLGLRVTGQFGEQDLGLLGELPVPMSLETLSQHIGLQLLRPALALGDPRKPIHKVAWCTGGAQSYFREASNLDIDCFITGEASEFVTHLAQESGVAYIAAGHHATERFGVQALGEHLATEWALQVTHLELDNPV